MVEKRKWGAGFWDKVDGRILLLLVALNLEYKISALGKRARKLLVLRMLLTGNREEHTRPGPVERSREDAMCRETL